MKKKSQFFKPDLLIPIILIALCFPGLGDSATTKNRHWRSGDYRLAQTGAKEITIYGSGDSQAEMQFELDIEGVYPESLMPLALVTTYKNDFIGTMIQATI